jgi:hypothetical protein
MKRLRQNLKRRTSAAVGIRDVLARLMMHYLYVFNIDYFRTKEIGKASLSMNAGKEPVTGLSSHYCQNISNYLQVT